jgi:hypothetical protein
MTRRHALFLLLVWTTGCMKLDDLFFEVEKASSVKKDYHGLPVTLEDDPPDWMLAPEIERRIYLETPSGRKVSADRKGEKNVLHGVFMPAPADCPEETCPLVGQEITFLYQHGNSGHLFRYWYRAVALWSLGANVFIYTYRGYGLSGGEANRKNVLTDAGAAMTYVKGRNDVNPNRIIAYGYSMGGIPTSHLIGTSEHAGEFFGAVLESALDSPDSTLNLSTNTEFPNGFFMDETLFDGTVFIKGAPKDLPILHFHGAEDERVVIEQGEHYFDVLKTRGNYVSNLGEGWLREAGHRNVPIASFKGELHIPDYYDDDKNPTHCCIHPIEYTDPAHAGFLKSVGKTTGKKLTADAERYRDLVADWVLDIVGDAR